MYFVFINLLKKNLIRICLKKINKKNKYLGYLIKGCESCLFLGRIYLIKWYVYLSFEFVILFVN